MSKVNWSRVNKARVSSQSATRVPFNFKFNMDDKTHLLITVQANNMLVKSVQLASKWHTRSYKCRSLAAPRTEQSGFACHGCCAVQWICAKITFIFVFHFFYLCGDCVGSSMWPTWNWAPFNPVLCYITYVLYCRSLSRSESVSWACWCIFSLILILTLTDNFCSWRFWQWGDCDVLHELILTCESGWSENALCSRQFNIYESLAFRIEYEQHRHTYQKLGRVHA